MFSRLVASTFYLVGKIKHIPKAMERFTLRFV